jgi:ubiquinone/menaquinone biosynthesis C-methylase UbiE
VDASREQYRRIASRYDRKLQIRLGEPSRRQAFADFDLRPGDTVLDVGCGTGLSFELLEAAIGPSGKLIGIEPSPEMLRIAQNRVSNAGWNNVTLIETSAEGAEIPVEVDAVVIFRVHEVLRSRTALEHLFASAKPGARVLVVGVKWAQWYLFPLNALIWALTKPWDLLTEFVPNLDVRQVGLGTQYVAKGKTAR